MNFQAARWIGRMAVALGVLAIAAQGLAQTGGLAGTATLQDGRPCAKCRIVIERQGFKETHKTKTDKKGEYAYIGLPLGNYKVILENPSGLPLAYKTKNVALGPATEVDFDLKNEPTYPQAQAGLAQSGGQRPPLSQNPPVSPRAQQQEASQQQQASQQSAVPKGGENPHQSQVGLSKTNAQYLSMKTLFEKGVALQNQHKYKEAAAAFEKTVPLTSGRNLHAVLDRLADCYDRAQENEQAAGAYQKVLQLDPNDAGAHNNLGNIYARMGKIAEAQEQFQAAVKADPTNAERYYFNLGATMYNVGKMDEALQAFKKVTEIDPNNAEAYYLLGQALVGKATMTPEGKVKAPPGTIEAFQKYLKLDPNGPNAATARAMIQTLRGGVQTQYRKRK